MSARPASAVPSPCSGVCRIDDASGWCEGCLRTLDEIGVWSLLDDAEKRLVHRDLDDRRRARDGAADKRAGTSDAAAAAATVRPGAADAPGAAPSTPPDTAP